MTSATGTAGAGESLSPPLPQQGAPPRTPHWTPLCLDPEGRGIPNASRDSFDFDLVSSILQSKRSMYMFSSG